MLVMYPIVASFKESNQYGLVFLINNAYPVLVSNVDGKVYNAHSFSNYRPEVELKESLVYKAILLEMTKISTIKEMGEEELK